MTNEFKRGSVLVQIGDHDKWLVSEVRNNRYHLESLPSLYQPTAFYIAKEKCEAEYVKVGVWDFENSKEVDSEDEKDG